MRVSISGVCECKGEYEVECEGVCESMRVTVSVGCLSVRVSMR